MMTPRKILAVTGIRSEYDMLTSVYAAIHAHPQLQLQLFVTGAHLSPLYGETIRDIEAKGWLIADRVESLLAGDRLSSRAKGLSIQLQGLLQTVERVQPDFLLVLGDREEAMSTALVGAYLNIPVVHIAGGDRVVGNVDDQVRHAVTKLAHLHFVTNQESYERILKLGEEPFRVFNTGNPGLDRYRTTLLLSDEELASHLKFQLSANQPLLMVIQHVISTEVDDAYEQMIATLEAVKQLELPTVLSFPNSDAGSQQLIKAIRSYENLPYMHVFANVPQALFINLMRRAHCLLGNSSAGILEAPLLKLPVVNVGNRQHGRLHANNVQFVPHDSNKIMQAVQRAVFDANYRAQVASCENPYGDGYAAEKMVAILADIAIDAQLLVKDITY